jgi:hypothetical protein
VAGQVSSLKSRESHILHGALVGLAELAECESTANRSSCAIRSIVSCRDRVCKAQVAEDTVFFFQVFESLSEVEQATLTSGLQSRTIVPAACRVIETSATAESHEQRIWQRFIDAGVRHGAPECHEAAAKAAAVVSTFGDCDSLIDASLVHLRGPPGPTQTSSALLLGGQDYRVSCRRRFEDVLSALLSLVDETVCTLYNSGGRETNEDS